ncbi:GGDEF domain-containing protein [Virgibacillus sp. C22-A2]|uniref:GGDEF domain-containing protein n=1 Tax=Virgibacillus tibetensis TaxID=3042313 RepID=A0ABU6KDH7_9BACI|nr:GGDEF domain-containing protein [Virgibacillus sp. C22-A2]
MSINERNAMGIFSVVQSILYFLVVIYFWGSSHAWWLTFLFLVIMILPAILVKLPNNLLLILVISVIHLSVIFLIIAHSGHTESPFYPMYYLPIITTFATSVKRFKKRSIMLISILASVFTFLHVAFTKDPELLVWLQGCVNSVSYFVLGFGVLFYQMQLRKTISESKTDYLTGLYNKQSGEKLLLEEIKKAKAIDYSVTVAFCDLDNFKSINDTYGHLLGDSMLKQAASIIRESVPGDASVVRWGGEEFLLVLRKVEKQEGIKVMERIRKNIESHQFSYHGKTIALTISGGIVEVEDYDHNILNVLDEADKRLYIAKNTGKNRIIS